MSVAIGTAIGYYFGQKASTATMHSLSNGVTGMMTRFATAAKADAAGGASAVVHGTATPPAGGGG